VTREDRIEALSITTADLLKQLNKLAKGSALDILAPEPDAGAIAENQGKRYG
jgi:hypothetical protein